MPWSTVESHIKFWTTGAWSYWASGGNGAEPFSFIGSQEATIKQNLEDAYATSASGGQLVSDFLDEAAAAHDIRLGRNDSTAGISFKDISGVDPYIILSPTLVNNVWYFNDHGVLVQNNMTLTVLHEMAHNFLNDVHDHDRLATESQMNTGDFDFQGSALFWQNEFAKDIGMDNNVQVSYFAAGFASDLDHDYLLNNGESWTENGKIDIARIGNAGDNIMDHSQRTDLSSDLLIGEAGNDVLRGADGNDYLYGGNNNDLLDSGTNILDEEGDGGDRLFGVPATTS